MKTHFYKRLKLIISKKYHEIGSGISNAYVGFTIIWASSISTIYRSYWAGDDWPNSQTPYWIEWRFGELNNLNIWSEAMFWNDQWMRGAGRFYPFSWIESRFVFSYFQELWQYKTYQFTLLFISGILFVYVCYLLSKSHYLCVIILASLSLTVQFRRDFDPHLAFSAMLPSLLIKIMIAVIFAFRTGKCNSSQGAIIWSLLSGVIYFSAISTYEFGFLLFPMLFIAFIAGIQQNAELKTRFSKNSYSKYLLISTRFYPIFLSWIGYAIFVFGYLRPKALEVSGAYVIDFSLSSVRVLFSQIFSGIPLISFKRIDLNISFTTVSILVVLLLVATFSLRNLFNEIQKKSSTENLIASKSQKNKTLEALTLVFALNMIFAPGFMMSIQPVWWDQASFTKSYLGVMITEFGTSLFIAIILRALIIRNTLRVKNNYRKKS
jgi:hypothetical protein